jgi:hypothetical protein
MIILALSDVKNYPRIFNPDCRIIKSLIYKILWLVEALFDDFGIPKVLEGCFSAAAGEL